jgi:recombination protein RecT
MSTTLVEPPKEKATIRSLLTGDRFKQEVALALPKHLTAERFIRVALTALSKDSKLANCDQASFFKSLLDLSAVGLEPDGRRAHLIPYGTECKLVIDWKGYVELAKRSGTVKSWRGELVCERDIFRWVNGVVHHEINWREDRGAVQCAYSHVTLADGSDEFDVMTLAEVKAIQARSPAGQSGPWRTDWNEMAKKTPIRRHSKRLTLSPEFHKATELDFDNLPRANAQVVTPTARPQLFSPPAATAEFAANAHPLGGGAPENDDDVAGTEPPAQTKRGWPKGRPRKQAAPEQPEPPDEISFRLSPAEEESRNPRAKELRDRVRAAGLSEEGFDLILARNSFPPVGMVADSEAAEILESFDDLLKAAKEEASEA